MTNFVATAELLRAVKAAQQRFLALWALDCLFDETRFVDKLAADLQRHQSTSRSSGESGWTINS